MHWKILKKKSNAYKNLLNILIKAIPGIPKTPVVRQVSGFKAMWRPKYLNIRLKINIPTPPRRELNPKRRNHLIGFMKNQHIRYSMKKPVRYKKVEPASKIILSTSTEII